MSTQVQRDDALEDTAYISSSPIRNSTASMTAGNSAPEASGTFAEPQNPAYPAILPIPSPNAASVSSLAPRTLRNRYFHSRRLKDKDALQKPWLEKRDPREKWVTIIPVMGIIIGLSIAGVLVYNGITSVINHKYCEVLNEDWKDGFRDEIWTREVELGGYGNGQFEFTTPYEQNSYIGSDGFLHIRPTITDSSLILNDNVLNLTAEGICTSINPRDCVTQTSVRNGSIINPVRSARIHTKKSISIRYGRVEVRARIPEGKWLWPAIWMMPVNNTYGEWPRSGEIDIMESRGNSWKHKQGGNNIISSALHWGPDAAHDAWWRTNNKRGALHTTYAEKYHTFGLEWSENYLFTYVNSRLLQVMFVNFDVEGLWNRGQFPFTNANGTKYLDPWSQTGRRSTPFDQNFYLVLNLAVGGTNGWFENGVDGKPWVDGSPSAKKDFWEARGEWLKTWKNDGEMVIESVKIWQQCD
ncbi:concanavalin A-like lectin/glucanase domain-containing protein [Peziza echinospora]|nr:concanavalin A-like lectin/glucanase domain-containing protein [Peziza echinospora]